MTRTNRWMAAISLAALLLLTGCGSGSSTTAGGPTTGAPSSSSFTPTQVRNILQCLRDAGLSHVWAPSAAPSGGTTESPMASPGGPVRFPPGLRFSDPKVVKALHTCRITLPGFAPSS